MLFMYFTAKICDSMDEEELMIFYFKEAVPAGGFV